MAKLCKYCKSELPEGAKICPTCKKKQKGPVGIIVAVVIVFVLIASVAGTGDKESSKEAASENIGTTESNTKSVESSNTDESITESNEIEKEEISMTTAQKNAYKSAKNYLSFMGFSKQGLINQLSSEYGDGYEVADAEFAVNYLEENGEVDWNEQAYRVAKNYLNTMSFSLDNLINQLESSAGDKFTHEQAVYGAEKAYNE